MKQWTYLAMKTKLESDLDLQDELFIPPAELLGYFNEAIDNCEAQIHTLYEDYFLTPGSIPMVQGTQDYSFPSDIYAMKVRCIYYTEGQIKYQVRRWKKPLWMLPFVEPQDDYMWLPINTSASGYQVRLYPPAQLTSSTNMTIWYIRNAKELVNDTDVCDIPEFITYILQFVKMRCYEKEGHVSTLKAISDTKEQMELMIATLTALADDEETEIRKDFSFYEDFDTNFTI